MFLIFSIFITTNTYSEISAEDAIKTRKALFSKNYNTAKRVQSLSSNGEFDEAKELMNEMSSFEEGKKLRTLINLKLDQALKDANKNYKVARGKSLKGVKVTTISPSIFHEWSGANKKKGGQVKMEKVMGEEKFAEWEDFVNQQR